MSSLTNKPIRILFYAGLAVLVIFLLVSLSAAATVGLLNLAQYAPGPVGTFLVDKGPARIMRRALMIGIIIIIAASLRKFGWRGWRDCGWARADDETSSRRAQFAGGAAIGIISFGALALLTIFTGLHQLKPLNQLYQNMIGAVFFFALSGLAVAIVEETICRGILFRVFTRRWRAWPAALIISFLFAAAHFVGPGDAAFQGSSPAGVVSSVSLATARSIVPPPNELIRFFNLALLGIVLCVFVMRTKTIWMSVGAHAAWVFTIKLHSYFTDFNPAAVYSIWLGKRNDFTDSLSAALIFLVLILLAFLRNKKAGRGVNVNGRIWQIQPDGKGLDNFLGKGESLFAGGKILKAYPGCRVIAKNGLVLKEFSPKNFLNGLRFAFRRPRSRRAFLLAEALVARGLPTPPVLAWSARRRCSLLMGEAMIVGEVTNAEQLTSWLERKQEDPVKRGKVMEAYGNLMADFHCSDYSNRDLKHENVMCSKSDPALLQVIDLDGVRKRLFISRRRAGRDLMRVGKSLASLGWNRPTDIAAFFGAYNRRLPSRLHFTSFPD